MICIIALVVFAILGIFSVSYREMAKEAWKCVALKLRLKPCDTGLDIKLKTEVMKLFKYTPKLGSFIYKYFEVFSWLLVILTLISIFYIGYGGYNYYLYGNCNGPGSDGFCIFDPSGSNKYSLDSTSCSDPSLLKPENLKKPSLSELQNYPYFGNNNSKVVVIEFGCFVCPYTQQASSIIKQIKDKYYDKINFIFIDVPLSQHKFSYETGEISLCVNEQGNDQFWNFYFDLFKQPVINDTIALDTAHSLNLNQTKFDQCYSSHNYKSQVELNNKLSQQVGIYGTPTFFINNQTFVGPKSYKELSKAINKELS